ncbi:MAG TPA: hypothetical protein PK313_03450 [Myxococcota bacterium]|nr:hypothetical protein [Myxococcota bacterium]
MKRRTFLVSAAAIAGGVAAPWLAGVALRREPRDVAIPPATPRSAAVVWFSQTGHTRRIGRLVAHRWRAAGLDVLASDYRECDPALVAARDLVLAGTPVNYYEAPGHFRAWLDALPPLHGRRCAAFATFGGPGDNAFNAAAGLLGGLARRGALPLDVACLGNMSTFAPTWSLGNEARTLAYRHLPDAGTFDAARRFADGVLRRAVEGRGTDAAPSWNAREVLKGGVSVRGTRMLIGAHAVDPGACIGCDDCVRGCPVGAVAAGTRVVDDDRCVVCLGCVNNCPTGAMGMRFLGRPVVGFRRFLEGHGIRIAEPPELADGNRRGI